MAAFLIKHPVHRSFFRPVQKYTSSLFPDSPTTTFLAGTFQKLLFSSSSNTLPNEEDQNTARQIPIIKPVSYAPKPKVKLEPEDQSSKPPNYPSPLPQPPRENVEPTQSSAPAVPWTREDFRYVKDIPSIQPVSYPVKVAPLPKDKEVGSKQEGEEERRKVETEAENDAKVQRRRVITRTEAFEKEAVLPFPTLIKVEKKKAKAVLDLQEAIKEVKANAKRKFDETVEAHVILGVDPRRGDQMVRGAATLPHGTGKTVRIAVFAEGAAAEEARAAGADIVGGDELIEEIRKGGKLNFDKCISTPIFMPRLSKIARILGPRGLMPNNKLGSLTNDVGGAVQDAKRGRVDFKIDKTAIVHVGLGKVSFTEETLRENVGAFVNALLLAKPVGLKKTSKYVGYVKSFSLCSTMGPGFPVSIQSLSLAADHYNKLRN